MRFTFILFIIPLLFSCQRTPFDTSQSASVEKSKTKTKTNTNIDSLAHKTIVAKLDLAIRETSGLSIINNTYWTINDSGNEPKLYQFELSSGNVLKTVTITAVENHDWEELTEDKTHMYIGDFGNNRGGRDNLMIYKVDVAQLLTNQKATAKIIEFNYPDQKQFYSAYNHNFDCEAMVSSGDSLYLFSKNWLDRKCKLYSLSKKAEKQTANLINEFDTGGTITAAALDEDEKRLYLLGYNGIGFYSSFLWEIKDWEGSDFFTGSKTKYMLTMNRQTEGIVIDKDGSLLISAEQNKGGSPSLFSVTLQ